MGFYLENGWKRKKEVMMDVKPTDIQRPHFFIDDGPQMCFYVEKGGARVTRCLLKRDFFHENIKGVVHTEMKLVIVDIYVVTNLYYFCHKKITKGDEPKKLQKSTIK